MVRLSVLEEKLNLCGKLQFAHKTLKIKVSVFSLIFTFLSIFGTKRKHTVLTNSEYAKELVRISVLEEKLSLWWKLQSAAQDAKI